MVMSHLTGSQEAAAMRGEPVDEVVMVQVELEALLHQQSELADCQVVVTVPAQQREEGACSDTGHSRAPRSSMPGIQPRCNALSFPLPAMKPPQENQKLSPRHPRARSAPYK